MSKNSKMITYVGAGEDSPRVIDFMGLQRFVRGQPVEVKDPIVLAKVKNNPCFTDEEVDMEVIHEMDREAKEKADQRRLLDKKINSLFHKQFKSEK